MKTLQYGDEGIFVRYLQTLLKMAYKDCGKTDGIFGRRTLRALTAFQHEHGIQTNGTAGNITWSVLYPYLCGCTIVMRYENETVEALADRYGISVSSLLAANPDTPWSQCRSVKIPFSRNVVFDDTPYTSFLTTAVIEGLCMRYPFIERKTIGVSKAGEEIEMIVIGSGPLKLGVNAAHHANEWITTPLTLMFAERFAEAIVQNGAVAGVEAKLLAQNATLYIIPLVNPDGVDLVNGAFEEEDSYYQSARALAGFYPSIPFPSGWKANIGGIDLNLGYPVGWEKARAIKFAHGFNRPGPRDYVGTHPFEAPEVRTMMDITNKIKFDRTISYHTQGAEIYFDYQGESPNGARRLADRFASVSGYSVSSAPHDSGFAGYKDWFIKTYQKCGFTIEAGRGVNPLPISMLPEIYRENEGILVAAMMPDADT